jgi:hypothetical protein
MEEWDGLSLIGKATSENRTLGFSMVTTLYGYSAKEIMIGCVIP